MSLIEGELKRNSTEGSDMSEENKSLEAVKELGEQLLPKMEELSADKSVVMCAPA